MPRWGIFTIIGILITGLVIGIYIAQQSQTIEKFASGGQITKLLCDSGADPYNSNTIVITNNSSQTIPAMSSDVFRCQYEPNRLKKSFYKCEDSCVGDNEYCQEGLWDPSASTDFSLAPGESKTVTVNVGPCEIVQIDAQNNEIDLSGVTECHNVSSQYTVPIGDTWPGGIAFGIKENATGYNASTGTCDTPQATATPKPQSTPVPTSTPSPTRQPTAPPGQPTYTPIPTRTPTPVINYPTATPFIPTNTPFIESTATPMPTQPVSGGMGATTIGILGGIGLLILTLL